MSKPPARQTLPDQLRGLALLGIVFVNMPFLALSNGGLTRGSVTSWADGAVAFLIVALAQGKFYLLFAFLFGYSLTLLRRDPAGHGAAGQGAVGRGAGGPASEGQDVDALRPYRRRLVGLAALGLLHATLFFIGDILLSYALLGLALLWFAGRSTRTALLGAGVAYAAGLLVLGLLAWSALAGPPSGGGLIGDVAGLDAAIRGSFGEAAQARLRALPDALTTQAVLNWAPALSMFLLGLAAGRAGLLARPEQHRRLWTRLLAVALVVGLPAGALSAWLVLFAPGVPEVNGVLGVALGFAAAPALTGGYVALAALGTRSRLLALAAPAGRMSLTGYLGESILLGAVFSGWGLGLYGQLPLAWAALVTLGVWLALEVFAALWLRRFAHGPFEWALRCWSRGRWLPLRRLPAGAPGD